MKVDIRDEGALAAVSPLDLLAYLRTGGWAEVRNEPGRFAIWIMGKSDNPEAEILLPLDRTVRDFARRIHEALEELERVERRSELEILHDLATTSADVIRVRLDQEDQAAGSILIDHGVALIDRARDLLLASACSALSPRPSYGPRRPQKAVDFVRRTRLGQTEHGSYVITLISRVSPELGTVSDQMVDEPFERQVTTTLAQAVGAVQRAAERAVVTGNLDAFRDQVEIGVSANLCDAIVGMAGGTDEGRGITFDFSWARTRPFKVETSFSPRVVLGSDVVPVIAEAARMFRETMPQDDYEVLGPVVKLERYGEGDGQITVVSLNESPPRTVRIALKAVDYSIAVEAHSRNVFVSVAGTLKREGRSWNLNEPRLLRAAE